MVPTGNFISPRRLEAMTNVIAHRGLVDFANAIAAVLRNPDLYRRLSSGCLEATRTSLSWDTIGGSVADALWGVHRQGRRTQTQ